MKQPRILPKVIGFTLALTLFFTLISNLLPQIESEAPVEKELDISHLTMDSFVSMGEKLFTGKGNCTLCHQPTPMGRAPDLQNINVSKVSKQRINNNDYKGDAKNDEEYLRESMLYPSKYVVKGWGNDDMSPMPAVDQAPLELSEIEVNAIIAYMQSKDGNTVSVALPTKLPKKESKGIDNETEEAAEEAAEHQAEHQQELPAPTAEAAFAKYGCLACHTILDSESPVGPSLKNLASRLSKDEIRQSILEPSATITEGFKDIMPKDFATRIKAGELETMVDWLSQKQSSATSEAKASHPKTDAGSEALASPDKSEAKASSPKTDKLKTGSEALASANKKPSGSQDKGVKQK
jgi:cytochrome c551/c552